MSSSTDNMIAAAFANLPNYLGQHVLLSVSALVLGLLISLPLAIAAARIAWLRGPALGVASVIQTIPSLALLALFYPLLLVLSTFTEETFGVGFRALGFLPALLALTLYSMLPVLRNTITALVGTDPAITMAARGVGMTPRQSMWLVELPLAAPIIMAGIRTAAVWVIGTATLSTPVGQTSLGNYIFTGLQTENWVFVLFGCFAAAGLALVIDRLLALAETGLAVRSRTRVIGAAVGLLIVIGASLVPLYGKAAAPVVVGTKNFEEQYILGALVQDRLRKAGIPTVRRDSLGSSVIFRALASGDVGVYVDYSGTVWTNYMKRTDMPGRQAVMDGVAKWLKKTYGILDLGPLGFENTYAFCMKRTKAEALGISSIADLAKHAANLSAGADYEFFGRPEWAAVKSAYRFDFARRRQFQSNFMYRAVADGDVDVISGYSSDGRIEQYDLKVLTDPKDALPPYDAIILVSPKYANDPKVIAALKPLLGKISLKRMQHANLLVDRETNKLSAADAAKWLETQISP